MKKYLALIALIAGITAANADDVIHYACHSGDNRYALTVNTDRAIVKMIDHGPPHTETTFRIIKDAGEDCGKGGWILNENGTRGVGVVTFFTRHKVLGIFKWHGHAFDCDQADIGVRRSWLCSRRAVPRLTCSDSSDHG